MLRRILFGLLFTFLLLLIAFAFLVTGSALAKVAGDAAAEVVLWWIGMGALIAALITLVSMVVALALLGLGAQERTQPDERDG